MKRLRSAFWLGVMGVATMAFVLNLLMAASDGQWLSIAASAVVGVTSILYFNRKARPTNVVVAPRVARLGYEAEREMKRLGMRDGTVHELIERHRAAASLSATSSVFQEVVGDEGQAR